MPLLDLSGADTTGFEALPSGTYDAEIFAAEMRETKGGEKAKLPKGTPMINVQFRVIGGPTPDGGHEHGEDYDYYNRRVFRTYVIPPEKIGNKKYEHAAKMKGILVTFLTHVGYSEEELADDFDLDLEDLVDRVCRVSVKKKIKYGVNPDASDFDPSDPENFDNEVTGTKVPSEAVASGGSGLL